MADSFHNRPQVSCGMEAVLIHCKLQEIFLRVFQKRKVVIIPCFREKSEKKIAENTLFSKFSINVNPVIGQHNCTNRHINLHQQPSRENFPFCPKLQITKWLPKSHCISVTTPCSLRYSLSSKLIGRLSSSAQIKNTGNEF